MDKVKSEAVPTNKPASLLPLCAAAEGRGSYDVDSIVRSLGTHYCVVKPGTEGSALGVFIVEGAAAIGEADREGVRHRFRGSC